jgi:hypothetical protein
VGENHCRRLLPYGEWGRDPLKWDSSAERAAKRRADLAGNSGMEPRNCGHIVWQIELESVTYDGEVGARMPLAPSHPADRHKPSCRPFRAK